MTTNRVLLYLPPRCRCDHARHLLEGVTARTRPIEEISGETIEFWLPGPAEIADEGINEIGFTLRDFRPEAASIDADLAGHVSSELRRIASRLSEASDRIATLSGGKGVS